MIGVVGGLVASLVGGFGVVAGSEKREGLRTGRLFSP